METPGEYFKRERALRGVSLQKIFEVTRAPLKYLEAIEADDTDSLPSPIFVKGYIRAYCKYLGLDANDAVLRYEIFLKERTEKPAEAPASFEAKAAKNIPAVPARAAKAAAIAAAAIAVIIVLYFVSTRGRVKPVPQAAKDVTIEAVAPAQDVKVASPIKTSEAQTPASSTRGHEKDKTPPAQVKAQAPFKKEIAAPAPSAPSTPSTKTHTLTLKATRNVWVRAGLDDKEPTEATFKEGDSFTWRAERVFSMRFGDAGAVSLTLDGVDIGSPGKSGQVLDLKLPAEKGPAPPQAAAIKKPEEKAKTTAPKEAPKPEDAKPPVAVEGTEKAQEPKPADAP